MAEVEASVAIVHALREDAVLLIRRTERADDPWSGQWSLPGGRCDPEDRDALDTALRELEEECGIRLAREQLGSALPLRQARRRAGRFVPVYPFVFPVESRLPTQLAEREAAEALWLPLASLRDASRHCLRCVPGMPVELHFPAVDMTGTVPLWGFTYRLLCEWLGFEAAERAGAHMADRVLEFLLTLGLSLQHGWEERGNRTEAAVRGAIPVEQVLARFAAPAPYWPVLNCLEVHPERVRLLGPAYEEYVIEAVP